MHEPIESLPAGSNMKRPSPRRALLDLAPLELDCMNTLWPMGEGTVREIRDRLAERLPRAYTTIMTIMDRLARKGIVERRKVNRAYIYSPNLTAEQARTQALAQVLSNFFGGSKEALLLHLSAVGHTRAAAAAAGASAAYSAPGHFGGVAVQRESEPSDEGASPLPHGVALSGLK
jgi:BlaI family penicillinase repressor